MGQSENKSRKASVDKYNSLQLYLRLLFGYNKNNHNPSLSVDQSFSRGQVQSHRDEKCNSIHTHTQGAGHALKNDSQWKSCEFRFSSRTLLRTITQETASQGENSSEDVKEEKVYI